MRLFGLNILFCFLSCAFNNLNAQETYRMNFFKDTTKTPTSYAYYIYKIDFFDIEPDQLLYKLDTSRFSHPNMTGFTDIIRDFEFTDDRSQIYLVEVEGDLYRYTISSDIMEYLGDLTPATTPFGVHNYTGILNIFFENDSILYCAGFTYGRYNINTGVFTTIRQPTDLATAFTPYEQDRCCTRITKYKDKYIYCSNSSKLMVLDPDNPDNNYELFSYLPPVGYINHSNIIAYQYQCDSTKLYILRNLGGQLIFYWNEIDMNSGDYKQTIRPKNPSTVFKNYNNPDWEDCQRKIDLDEDDSTIGNFDYLTDSLCYYTDIPLSDLDVKINNENPLDSIVVEIENSESTQYVEFQSGNYIIKGNKSADISITNNGSTTNSEFEDAIKTARYFNSGLKKGGEVNVIFIPWYKGISGDTAKAIIKIINPLPNTGEDILKEYCLNSEEIDIFDILSEHADKSGMFYNISFEETSSKFNADKAGFTDYYYIVSNQGCYDTSRIEITVNPLPEIINVEDQILCFGDTFKVELNALTSNIIWYDEDSLKVKYFNKTGKYYYTAIDSNSCENTDTFNLKIMPKASTNPIEAKVCEGEIFNFQGKDYTESGQYSDTLKNVIGCDSVIYNIEIKYFEKIPIEISGELGFCEGESTVLDIISNHNNLSLDAVSTESPLEINNEGKYLITGYDENGCIDSIELEIEEYPLPEIATEDLIDIKFDSGIELPVEYFGDIISYIWTPSQGLDCYECPFPKLISDLGGIYTINVETEKGCKSESTITVIFKKIELYIPNVIASNSEINGIFYIKSNIDLKFDLQIFDRWGELLFDGKQLSTNAPGSGWHPNGKYKPGVYVYKIEFEENGEKKIIAGDITLL